MKAKQQILDISESNSVSSRKKKQITRFPSNINFTDNTRRKAKQLEQKIHRTTKQRQKIQEPIPSYLPKKRVDHNNQRQNAKQIDREKDNSPEKQLLINNSQLIAIRESLLNENTNIKLSDLDMKTLSQLLEHLREYSAYCVLQRQYDEAEQANVLYEKIKDEVQMNNLNYKFENNENSLYEEEDISYPELKKAKMQQFKIELEDYDLITIKKRQELDEKLLNDSKLFEENWKVNMPRKYRKPSSKLIELYEIERKFGLTGQFQEAKKIKIEADRLQNIEMAQAQKRLVHDYTIAKSQFDKQQEKERQIFEDTRNHWRSVVVARQKVEMEAIKNRKTVLSVKQTEPKVVKESSIDSPSKISDQYNNGGAAVYRKENIAPRDILLPPLMAPNDEKMKELRVKEIESQKTRIQQFKANQRLKELEDDLSEKSTPRVNSPRSDFLLPAPSIKSQKSDRSKSRNNKEIIKITNSGRKVKSGLSHQSDYSISETFLKDDDQTLDIHLDVDMVRNILQEKIKSEINESSLETANINCSNENTENININNSDINGPTTSSTANEVVRKSITFQLTETNNFK